MNTNDLAEWFKLFNPERYAEVLKAITVEDVEVTDLKCVQCTDVLVIVVVVINNGEQETADQLELQLRELEDEGNPEPSINWFYGTGVITITGFS